MRQRPGAPDLDKVPRCAQCGGRHLVKLCPNVLYQSKATDEEKADFERQGRNCTFVDKTHQVECRGKHPLKFHLMALTEQRSKNESLAGGVPAGRNMGGARGTGKGSGAKGKGRGRLPARLAGEGEMTESFEDDGTGEIFEMGDSLPVEHESDVMSVLEVEPAARAGGVRFAVGEDPESDFEADARPGGVLIRAGRCGRLAERGAVVRELRRIP